ncbi:MAG: hypothetical protein KF867_03650 [Cryobacterium sp.]|nr:hypothetical protein [Cryobacterium sp.]
MNPPSTVPPRIPVGERRDPGVEPASPAPKRHPERVRRLRSPPLFSRRWGCPDVGVTDGLVLLDFAGKFSPWSVPTTLVLDRQGRVASRILGRIDSRGTLEALIGTVLDEKPPSVATGARGDEGSVTR